jgi:Domain of unknown function (DUF4123)
MSEAIEHLKAMLWAHEDAEPFAVLNGAVLPGLPEQLEGADVSGWDCLLRGAQDPDAAASAPYVVALSPEGAFTNWLLTECTSIYPGWGLIGVGPVNLLGMREFCRQLHHVETPDGQVIEWPWFNPALWAGLLPKLDAVQLLEAYGPLYEWVVPGVTSWTWLTWHEEGLQVDDRPVGT